MNDVLEQGLPMSTECIYCFNPSPFVFSPVCAALPFPFSDGRMWSPPRESNTLLNRDDHLLREITPNALLQCLTHISILPKHENSYPAHISLNYNKVFSSPDCILPLLPHSHPPFPVSWCSFCVLPDVPVSQPTTTSTNVVNNDFHF